MREEDWNDGYYIEGMDRCHTVCVMIEELLLHHPVVKKCEVSFYIEEAERLISRAYQKIGSLSHEDKKLTSGNIGDF